MNIPEKFKSIYDIAQKPLRKEKDIKMVEIIMLKYKSPEVETEAVRRIIAYTKYPFKLTVYDNRVNEGRSNISKIWNKLIKRSDCDYVFVIDSDAYVPDTDPCWLTKMMRTFEGYRDCYVVLPLLSRTSASEQQAEEAKEYPAKTIPMGNIFAAQAVLYKKDLFEKVGYFDENYYLYGQDSEFSLRLLNRPNIGVYIREDVFLQHLGSYSMNQKKREEKKKYLDMDLEREYAGYLFGEEHKKYEAFNKLYFKGEDRE